MYLPPRIHRNGLRRSHRYNSGNKLIKDLFTNDFHFLFVGCVEKLPWVLTEDGFMQGNVAHHSHTMMYKADSKTIRLVNTTSEAGQTAWKVGKGGFYVKLNFEKSSDCGGRNSGRQVATAITEFVLKKAVELTVTWSGLGETQGYMFEVMTLNIDGIPAATAHNQNSTYSSSCSTAPVLSDPVSPLHVKMNPGSHTINITLDTVDEFDNSDQAFYQVWFDFSCK